jgi:hypothetical protein
VRSMRSLTSRQDQRNRDQIQALRSGETLDEEKPVVEAEVSKPIPQRLHRLSSAKLS